MEPAARLFEATCRVLREDVLLFDPLERHGCPHAELEAVSGLQAAMAFGYAEAAVHAGRHDLLSKALALAGEVHHLPTRIALVSSICSVTLTESRRPLDVAALVEVTRSLPSEAGCLEAKGRALWHLAELLRSFDRAEEVAEHALQIAKRLRRSAFLGELLAGLGDLLCPASVEAALIDHLAASVAASLRLLGPKAEAPVVRAVVEQAEASLLPSFAGARDTAERVEMAAGWLRRTIVEPLLRERSEIDARIRECLGHRDDPPDLELLESLCDGMPSTVLASSGLPLLDPIERDVLRDALQMEWMRRSRAEFYEREVLGQLFERRERVARSIEAELEATLRGMTAPASTTPAPPVLAWQDGLAPDQIGLVERARRGDNGLLDWLTRADLEEAGNRQVAARVIPWIEAGIARDEYAETVARRLVDAGIPRAAARACARSPLVPALLCTLARSVALEPAEDLHWFESLCAARPPPLLLGRLLSWLDRESLADLWQRCLVSPGVARTVLDAVATVRRQEIFNGGFTASTLAEVVLAMAQVAPLPAASEPAPGGTSGRVEPDVLALLRRAPSRPRTLGRTILVAEGDRLIAFKLLRKRESIAALRREQAWLAAKREEETASLIPEPLGVVESVAAVDAELLAAIEAAGIELDPSHACLVYAAGDDGYWRYVNEVERGARIRGMHAAASDLFAWLRRGHVHTALTLKNHYVGWDATRRWEWMVDLCKLPTERRGMGRLDQIDVVNRYSNVRSTGIADLAEMSTLDAVASDFAERRDNDCSNADPIPNLWWHGADLARALHWVRFAGDYLLDLTLLVGDAYRRSGELRGVSFREPTEAVSRLAGEIRDLWVVCVCAFTEADPRRVQSLLDAAARFDRIAHQIAYFIEPDNYVDDFEATVTKTSRADGSARLERDDARSDELSRELAAALYDPSMTLRIDLSDYHARFFGREAGSRGFSRSGEHSDLGGFNSSWPLLELERALCVVAPMMLIAAGPEPGTAQCNLPGRKRQLDLPTRRAR
jgi:hypothetical protein